MSEQNPNLPEFRRRDWPFVGDRQLEVLRQMQDDIDRLSGNFRFSPGGQGQYNAEDSWGSRQINLNAPSIRGRITGQDTPGSPWYSFEQVTFYNDSTTLATGDWTFAYSGGFNDSTTFNAAELNGNDSVPFGAATGAIVTLYQMEDGQSWGFFFGGTGSQTGLFPVRIVYREWVTATAVVAAGGSGYAVDDTITLAADRVNLVVKVTTIGGGGAVTGSEIIQIGVYTIGNNPSNPQAQLSTSGSGTGATFTVNLVAEAGGWSPTIFYSWVEQIEDASGFLVDRAGGRTGTVPTNAAVHINRLFLRVGSKAWLRKVSPEVSVTYDGGPVLGPFYDMESWLLKVSDQGGNSETATTALGVVGDGGNVSTTLIRDAVDPGDVSVQVMMSASPSFTNLTVNNAVNFSNSTINFNSVTFINFTPSISLTFHGARFPSATSTSIGVGTSHKDCTFSVSGGPNFGAGGYDADNTLIAGGAAATISTSGYYHFTSATQWTASAYLNARMYIKTSANGNDIISKGLLRTSVGGAIDEDGIAIIECSGDYNCAAGDTITVQAYNMDTVLGVTLSDAMLHFHRIPTS